MKPYEKAPAHPRNSCRSCHFRRDFFVAEKTKKNPAVETPPVADTALEPAPAEQSGKIDEHLTINNELRDVNFCGKTYKVKQVLIDGVDVVQRVAELATKNQMIEKYAKNEQSAATCNNVNYNTQISDTIKVGKVISGTNSEKFNHKTYGLQVSVMWFSFDAETGDIYTVSGYDGALIGPIGKLK